MSSMKRNWVIERSNPCWFLVHTSCKKGRFTNRIYWPAPGGNHCQACGEKPPKHILVAFYLMTMHYKDL